MANMRFLHNQLVKAGIPILGVADFEEGETGRRVDFAPEATSQQQSLAQDWANGFATLALTYIKTRLEVNEELSLSVPSLTTFDYHIWQDGQIIQSGDVADGIIEFSSDRAGIFIVEVIDGFATGLVEIKVEE